MTVLLEYDEPDISRDAFRKARKPHKCCECGRTIEVGEEYWYLTGLWDGRWQSHHFCLECLDTIQEKILAQIGEPK